MNQKVLKYSLLGLVVIIWGLILYRIIRSVNHNDNAPSYTASKVKLNYDMPKDSFQLLADYPDPFQAAPEDTVSIKNDLPIGTGNMPLLKEKDEPDPSSAIRYLGMISNPAKKKRIALVTINGTEFMIKENETISDLHVIKIQRDKIFIIYKDRSYTIRNN